MPRLRIVAAANALVAVLLASVAMAQDAAPVAPPAPPPAYDEQLLRLSEILGAIHYLRPLCGREDEKDAWRAEMSALIEAEQPDAVRRARMVDSFNRGYEGFHSVYRTCTAAASESADRYLREGAKIAADITVRYGK